MKYPKISGEAFLLNDGPAENGSQRHAFDLEERTAQFDEAVIRFCKKVPRAPENNRLIDQLVGCSTSIGANYCEANDCVKEAKETKFFLRMIAASEPQLAEDARQLHCEAKELHLIFARIYRK